MEQTKLMKEGEVSISSCARDGMPTFAQSSLRLATGSHPKLAILHASWVSDRSSADSGADPPPPNSQLVYRMTGNAYESHAIMSERMSWCDEGFAGCGGKNATWLLKMHRRGVDSYILADRHLTFQSYEYGEMRGQSPFEPSVLFKRS